ncbi:chromate transporter [Paenibacillus anaericanus]|uniref:chromate transporter n=1 Tax=Paenibacillus anaericanus TaxID=170367 RepID=UPI002780AD86|nr:chromate transporter [Paenibacillus anaericanus]MDQ0088682.1 chromate transporter [Paenibacillus anaericanus]
MDTSKPLNKPIQKSRFLQTVEILGVSAKLGMTSFGGPIAHLGYYHEEYVSRRKWLDERSYADLVALCQFLPGPASSQVGIGIGLSRGGVLGAIAAWLGFTLPSAIVLIVFALFMQGMDVGSAFWLHGLKLTAVSIVAQAVWSMGRKLATGRSRATIAILAATISLIWANAFTQVFVIAIAGIVGLWLYRKSTESQAESTFFVPISRKWSVVCLVLYFGLLLILPLLVRIFGGGGTTNGLLLFDSFYRTGSLVFGSGHVVLPLLQGEVIHTGWVTESDFLAGYGLVQAVPGPLFTFASYLGVLISGIPGAIIATIAIFLPAFLLIVGVLPFWNGLRHNNNVQGALHGVNAAVVGILLAALYNPIWTTSVNTALDFVLVLLLFGMLIYWKLPSWSVVLAGAAGGVLLGILGN